MLEKTLESPLDCKVIKPILKEISPESSLEGLMLKLKLQYFGYLMWTANTFGKDPDPGKDWRQEEKGTTGWDGWLASPTQWTWVWVNSVSWWWTGRPGMLQSMGSQRVGHNWATSLHFASHSQSIGASASASVLSMNIQDWFLLRLTGSISLQSK